MLYEHIVPASIGTAASGAKRTLAKAAMSENLHNSEMVFGGSGLQATSKGEKLTSN
jgi:hypothetical protein